MRDVRHPLCVRSPSARQQSTFLTSTKLSPKMDSDEEEVHHYHSSPPIHSLATPTGVLEYEDYTRAGLSPTEQQAAIRLCRLVERPPAMGAVPSNNRSAQLTSKWCHALRLIRADSVRALQREPLARQKERRQDFMNNWCWHVADGLRSLKARLGHQYFDHQQPVKALLYLRQSYGQDPSAAEVCDMMVSSIVVNRVCNEGQLILRPDAGGV